MWFYGLDVFSIT